MWFKGKKEIEEDEGQFTLELNEPYTNYFYALKQRLLLNLKKFETRTFVRSFSNWFFIIISISLIATQFSYIDDFKKKLPEKFPLFLYQIDLEKRLGQEDNIYIIPTLSIVTLILASFLAYKWYNRKKNLAIFTIFFMFLSMVSMTFALAKLISQ